LSASPGHRTQCVTSQARGCLVPKRGGHVPPLLDGFKLLCRPGLPAHIHPRFHHFLYTPSFLKDVLGCALVSPSSILWKYIYSLLHNLESFFSQTMRLSLDSVLFILALAHSLASPVSANEGREPKRHMFKRATRGFHKSALRHSAGLAQDLRVALKGLGSANTPRAPVKARSNLGSNKPYCVPTNGRRQTNSSANWNPFGQPSASSSAKPSSTRSSTTSPTSSPGGQSAFKLAQSYVSNSQYGARIAPVGPCGM
jgi:hypothetical protein